MKNIKVIEKFVDEQTCNHMIDVYKNLFKTKDKIKDGRKIIRNSKEYEIVQFVNSCIFNLSNILNNKYYIRDLLLSVYEKGASLEPHVDFLEKKFKNSLGVLIYFNDNFEGGELYFSNFEYKFKPIKGSAIIFPCNDPYYEHGVTEVISGIRYTMPIEITTEKELTVY